MKSSASREMKRRVEEANGITLEEEVMVVMDPAAPGAVLSANPDAAGPR